MAKINHTITGLYGGVSQQSPDVRLENQCEEAINCKISVIDGVSKRYPTDFILKNNEISTNSKIYLINKDEEKYILVFNSSLVEPITIYDVNDGYSKKNVSFDEGALEYLQNNITNPQLDFDILNLSDTTIIVNKNVKVKMVDTFGLESENGFVQSMNPYIIYNDLVVGDNIKLTVKENIFGAEEIYFDYVVLGTDTMDTIATELNNQMSSFNSLDKITATATFKPEEAGVSNCPEFREGIEFFKLDKQYPNIEIINNSYTNECEISGITGDPTWGRYPASTNKFQIGGVQYESFFISSPVSSSTCIYSGKSVNTYSYEEWRDKAVFVRQDKLEYYKTYFLWSNNFNCLSDTVIMPEHVEINISTLIFSAFGIEVYDLTNYKVESVNELSDFGKQTNKNLTTEGFVKIQKGVIKNTYHIYINKDTNNEIHALYTTSDTDAKVDTIMDGLIVSLLSVSKFGENYEYIKYFNSIYIKSKNGDTFSIVTEDTYSNTAMTSGTDRVDNIIELPSEFKDGYVINVNPTDTVDNGGVWYEFKNNIWVETRKQNTNYILDYKTMPIKLEEDGGEFILKHIPYKNMNVGDVISTPYPSFVGNTINNIFFYKNRLCFSSGQNIIFSKNDDYFNFFYTTAIDNLDDDYIDVALGGEDISDINHITTFNENLIVMTKKTQFNITSNNLPFTSTNISATAITNFDNNVNCSPVHAGSNLYFTSNSGDFSTMREYFVQPDSLINDAADVTAHTPRYLDKNLSKIVYEHNEDSLIVGKSGSNTLFIYNYKWQGSQKIQSAWSKYVYDFNIIDYGLLEDEVYIIAERDNQVELLKYNIKRNIENYDIYLDRRSSTIINVDGDYVELFIQDYNFENDDILLNEKYVVIDEDGIEIESQIEFIDGDTIRFRHNGNISYFYGLGQKYLMDFKMSEINFKSNGSNIAENAGRLQLRNMTFSYVNSLYFDVGYKANNRSEKHKIFNGIKIGSIQLDSLKVKDGDFRVMLGGRNKLFEISITNDSYLPTFIQSISWTGFYTKDSQSV